MTPKQFLRLDQVARYAPAAIHCVHGQSDISRRLREMGLTNGTPIEVLGSAPFGGTLRVRCGGHQLALRTAEANLVEVRLT